MNHDENIYVVSVEIITETSKRMDDVFDRFAETFMRYSLLSARGWEGSLSSITMLMRAHNPDTATSKAVRALHDSLEAIGVKVIGIMGSSVDQVL